MKTIHKILIANRGEIACRIMRTCRKMGIASVAVYSDADKDAPFVRQADEALHIGASEPAASYLDMDKIIAAAKGSGADAIHPGYGFLSENAAFAERCVQEGIVFVGPHSEAIAQMGSKAVAKNLMQAHGVPTIPGYQDEAQDMATLCAAAEKVGYPLLLKAAAGGGGKGMRIVNETSELKAAIHSAKREGLASFGDDRLIIEKYFPSARHVEFQIFGDQHGNAIHLLERECSIQRRYQKIIEESPSPVLNGDLRARMGEAAVLAAKALGYDNAGTVEFILAENGDFFFLEVNTRLQVEHPVTEEITGLDLVEMQIQSAEGRPLKLQQSDVRSNGYAIECRLYAEDAENDFMPATGKVLHWECPTMEGLRIETGITSGSEVSVYYDPMIAKIICHAEDRATAHRKMAFALRNLRCMGLTTNQDFLVALLGNADFQAGNYDTHFIKNHFHYHKKTSKIKLAAIAACLYRWQKREAARTVLAGIPSGWRNNFYQAQQEVFLAGNQAMKVAYRYVNGVFDVEIAGQSLQAIIVDCGGRNAVINIDGFQQKYHIANAGQTYFVHSPKAGTIQLDLQARFPEREVEKVKGGYESPMPAQVVNILVAEGQEVAEGDGLIVLSSMKMESTIYAEEAGKVQEIYVEVGQNVEAGVLLLKLGEGVGYFWE